MDEKYLSGKIEFFREDQIIGDTINSFNGDPQKIVNGERKFRFVVDGEMVYVVLSGLMVYEPNNVIYTKYKQFAKYMSRRRGWEEVSRVFYTEENNSAKNISKITGFSVNKVANIITNNLLSKDDVFP